jgi:hypothetical protein
MPPSAGADLSGVAPNQRDGQPHSARGAARRQVTGCGYGRGTPASSRNLPTAVYPCTYSVRLAELSYATDALERDHRASVYLEGTRSAIFLYPARMPRRSFIQNGCRVLSRSVPRPGSAARFNNESGPAESD